MVAFEEDDDEDDDVNEDDDDVNDDEDEDGQVYGASDISAMARFLDCCLAAVWARSSAQRGSSGEKYTHSYGRRMVW